MEDAPDPKETGEMFRFIGEKRSSFPLEDISLSDIPVSLVAVTAKYGFIFIANKNVIKVYKSSTVLQDNSTTCFNTINAVHKVTHLSVSCDGLTVFVVVIANGCPQAQFYDVRAVNLQNTPVTPFLTTPLSTVNNSFVTALTWSPTDPCCIAVATSVGDLTLLNLKNNAIEVNCKKDIKAYALGWSSKGKQLTVGCTDGSLKLFKPDLTMVRTVQPPPIEPVGPALSLVWFSNTEFFIVYMHGDIPSLLYVNAPKDKPPKFINFEDICYSAEMQALPNYYMSYCPDWGMLFVLSSYGIEVGVVGRQKSPSGGNLNWQQWCPEESSRAEMHMVNVTQETYPLGLAIDYTSQKKFTVKEDKIEGPFPVLYSLSTGGELNIFHVDLKEPGTASLNVAPDTVPTDGMRMPQQYGGIAAPIPSVAAPAAPAPAPAPAAAQLPTSLPSVASAFSTGAKLPQMSSSQPLNFASGGTMNFGGSATFSSSLSKFTTPIKPTGGLFDSVSMPKPAVTASATPSLFMPTTSSAQLTSTPKSSAQPIATPNLQNTPPKTMTNKLSVSFQVPQSQQPMKPISMAPSGSISQGTPLITPIPTLPTLASTQASVPTLFSTASTMPTAKSMLSQTAPTVMADPATTPKEKKQPPPVLSDAKLMERISEEYQLFEAELRDHTTKNKKLDINIGSSEEKVAIKEKISDSQSWMGDMKTTMEEQCSEVSQLHSSLLENFTMLEEADKLREKKLNHKHKVSVENRPLDLYSRNKLKDIRKKYQYLVAQLQAANEKLEVEWESFSDRKKSKKKQDAFTSENICRVVQNSSNLRHNYEKDVDGISRRLKKIHLNKLSPFLPENIQCSYLSDSLNNTNIDDSALDELEQSLRKATLDSSPPPAVSPVVKVSHQKKNKLKEIFAQRQHIPLRSSTSLNLFLRKTKSNYDSWSESESPNVSTSNNEDKFLFKPNNSGSTKLTGSIIGDNSTPPQNLQTRNPGSSMARVEGICFSTQKYEDISPPDSPIKADKLPTLNANPLNALSSFVGNVTVTSSSSLGPTNLNSSFSSAFSLLPSSKGAESFNQKLSGFSQIKLPLSEAGSMAKPVETNATMKIGSSNTGSFFMSAGTEQASPHALRSTNITPLPTEIKQEDVISKATIAKQSPVIKEEDGQGSNGNLPASQAFSSDPQTSGSGIGLFSQTHSASKNLFSNVSTSNIFANTSLGGKLFGGVVATQELSTSTPPAFSTSNVSFKLPLSSDSALNTASQEKENLVSNSQATTLSTSGSSFNFKLPATTQSTLLSKLNSFAPTNVTLTSTISSSSSVTITSTSESALLPSNIFGGVSVMPSTSIVSSVKKENNDTSQDIQSVTITPVSSVETTSSTSVLFGNISSVSSLFSNVSSSNTSNAGTLFSGTTTITSSLFANKTPSLSANANTGSQTNVSDSATSSTQSTTASVFAMTSSDNKSIFGAATVSATVAAPNLSSTFGSTSISSVFGTSSSSTAPSVFGGSSATTFSFTEPSAATTTKSIFTSNVETTSTTTTTLASSVFGTTSNLSSFGITSSSSPSIFGTNSSVSSFGSTVTSPSPSIFGATTTTSTSPSIFGTTTTSSTSPSIFGTTTTTSSSPSIFGATTSAATPSVFGNSAPSTSSMFAATTSSSQSVFGASSSNTSLFAASTTTSSMSMFGASTTATPSLFGATNTTAASSPLFGNSNVSVFGNSGTSSFGAASSSSSVFGGSTSQINTNPASSANSVFGNSSFSTGGSMFGQSSAQPASGFGSSSIDSAFDQSGGSNVFGLGGKPSEENANKNVFGSPITDSKPQLGLFTKSSNNSLFGGGSQGAFGSSASSTTFGGGNNSVTTQSSFGSFTTPQKSPVFGGAPTFGGAPSFGASPTLGGNTAFGGSSFGGQTGASSFGQSGGGGGSVFGGTPASPSAGFSNFASSSGSSFGSLASGFSGATQQTDSSFGNLAQQSGSFGSSNLGGSSFSSWR